MRGRELTRERDRGRRVREEDREIFTIDEAAWSTSGVWGKGGRREGYPRQDTSFTKPSRHLSKSITGHNQFRPTLQAFRHVYNWS